MPGSLALAWGPRHEGWGDVGGGVQSGGHALSGVTGQKEAMLFLGGIMDNFANSALESHRLTDARSMGKPHTMALANTRVSGWTHPCTPAALNSSLLRGTHTNGPKVRTPHGCRRRGVWDSSHRHHYLCMPHRTHSRADKNPPIGTPRSPSG